jgi:hypothetical protein
VDGWIFRLFNIVEQLRAQFDSKSSCRMTVTSEEGERDRVYRVRAICSKSYSEIKMSQSWFEPCLAR